MSAPSADLSSPDADAISLRKVLNKLDQLTSIKLFQIDGKTHVALYGIPSSSNDSWVANLPASAFFLGDPTVLQLERLIAAMDAHQQAPFKPAIAKLLYTLTQRHRQNAAKAWSLAAQVAIREANRLREQNEQSASVAFIRASSDAWGQASACTEDSDRRGILQGRAYAALMRCFKIAQLEASQARERGDLGQTHALLVQAAEAQMAAVKLVE